MASRTDLDDDDDKTSGLADAGRRFTEFECPVCNAHNPYDDGFVVGDVLLCNYCGTELEVRDGPKGYRLKEA